MKNKLRLSHGIYCRGRNLIFVMKLTILAFFLGLMGLSASTYSQKTKLSIDLKNVAITEVLKSLESQSEFVFIYENEALKLDKKVSITVKEGRIDEILTEILKDTGIHFEILDKQVVITKTEEVSILQPLKSKPEEESQQPKKKELSGSVKDTKGMPLPGVTVIVKGTTTGTVTDNDGKFSLSVPVETKILVFSFVGMKMQEITITDKSSFNIALEEETIGLDDVVVVGYGIQRKVSVVGAISQVRSKELVSSGVRTLTNALSGLVPGLVTQQNSGQPGKDAATIFIRGRSSWQSSNPLILVDGIERSMTDIDPNEVEPNVP